MSPENFPHLPAELKSFEAELAGLVPSANFDRDRLMYQAGWAACEAAAAHTSGASQCMLSAGRPQRLHRTWLWPLTSAALLLVSMTLATVLVRRPVPEPEIVYVPVAAAPQEKTVEKRDDATRSSRTARSSDHSRDDSPLMESIARQSIRPTPSPIRQDYLALRTRVLAHGVDVLPSAPSAPEQATNKRRTQLRYGSALTDVFGG